MHHGAPVDADLADDLQQRQAHCTQDSKPEQALLQRCIVVHQQTDPRENRCAQEAYGQRAKDANALYHALPIRDLVA